MPDARLRRGLAFGTMMVAACALTSAAFAQDMPAVPAQQAAVDPQPPAAAPATPPAAPGPQTPAAQPLPQAQLDQLVAPIALYPDPVLSQVLMASTYPLEVIEAARWMRVPANQALTGDVLTAALKEKNWDPSVMALVPFPRVLALMAERVEWTEQLGNAFLAQQADVMSEVQRLRHAAQAAGNLKATPQCHCVIQTSGETISIMPSDTQTVCIPVYNPRVVYGAWPEPAYPPDEFPPPPSFAFEPGIEIGFLPPIELVAYGPIWGWGSIDWGRHDIVVDNGRFAALAPGRGAFAGGVWVHDPAHRGGVAYRDPAVTARFGAARVAAMTAAGRAGAIRAAAGGAHVAGGGAFARTGSGGVPVTRHGSFAAGPGAGPSRHAAAAFHAGGLARGPGPVGGGGPVARAQFSPGGHGGGPRGGGPGGGPHGGGGGPHGGGGGGDHHR